jgi:hypothetical protein
MYINLLHVGTKQDIKAYETWLMEVSKTPRFCWMFPLLINCRCLLGRRLILSAYQYIRCRRNEH